ncbi:MAG: DUF4292 domain-containing protein [Bacteroidales bacterium]|nr:DUF4292 domain-containing protein [Bacteroidales bacterium]
MKLRSYIFLFFIAIIWSNFSACKTSRRAAKAPIKEEGAEYLFSKLKENEFRFKTFDAKFNIEYNQGRKYFDFKGQIRIIKDSLIWINFNQDLGIEIARIMITEDSVKFLDRLKKQYLITDYTYINAFLNSNIDFGILQSIILGNDFDHYEKAKFKASVDGDQYKLFTGERSKLKKYIRNTDDETRVFLQQMRLNPKSFKINEIKLKELTKDSRKLTAGYSDFELLDGQLFPFTLNYLIEAEDAINVKVKYNRITLNENPDFPFKIPSKYTSAK